jgi:hypothetical protein
MTPAPDSPGQPPRSSLGRAAFFGLSAGLVIGGLGLLVLGLRGLFGRPDCTGLSKIECDFVLEAAAHVGRVQTICGGALVALALSLFVLARPYLSPRPSNPPT